VQTTSAAPVSPATSTPPAGESAIFSPDADEYSDHELIYDTSSNDAPPAPPPPVDVVVIPRYVIYLQGALLAVVALIAFAIGMTMESTFVAPPGPPAQACEVTGSVTYASGPRSRADDGAVVILLPLKPRKPAAKAPIRGLRPDDPSPSGDNKGLAILREVGGGYARTDANGRFQIDVASRGRYLLVAISHDKRSRSGSAPQPEDVAKLAPFFDNAAELLGQRQYQLSQETIRGDLHLGIMFD
jgi:hypothetical protein